MRECNDYELNTRIHRFLDRKLAERFGKRSTPITSPARRAISRNWKLPTPTKSYTKHHALTVRHLAY